MASSSSHFGSESKEDIFIPTLGMQYKSARFNGVSANEIKVILAKKPNASREEKLSALLMMIQSDDLETFKFFLIKEKINPNEVINVNDLPPSDLEELMYDSEEPMVTFLICAIRESRLDILKFLLELKEVDVNKTNKPENSDVESKGNVIISPLQEVLIGSWYNTASMLKELLLREDLKLTPNPENTTWIEMASKMSNLQSLDLLLDKGLEPTDWDRRIPNVRIVLQFREIEKELKQYHTLRQSEKEYHWGIFGYFSTYKKSHKVKAVNALLDLFDQAREQGDFRLNMKDLNLLEKNHPALRDKRLGNIFTRVCNNVSSYPPTKSP